MDLGIPYFPLIVVPAALAVALFWRRARWHIAILRAGRPINRLDRPWARIWSVVVYVIGQRRLLNDLGPGIMHAAIFWGFLILLVTTGNYFTNGLLETIIGWPLGGLFWVLAVAVANLFIAFILVALAYAIWRRVVARPARLALSRDAFIILGMIAGVVISEAFGDALRWVVVPDDPARGLALVGGPLSLLLEPIGSEAAAAAFGILAWLHIGFVMAFGAYLPYSKHLHILSSEPNVYLRNLEPRGALRTMDLEAEPAPGEELPVFGARGLKDLSWRHLLDGLSCTECGRCMEFCPASMTGKTLSPKHFMEGLRDQIVAAETAIAAAASAQRAAKGGAAGGVEASDHALGLARERAAIALAEPLVDHAIPEEAIWQCTTCGWCVEACPVLIEHVDSIVEIRRNLVLEEGRFPKELNVAFRNMETAGNPWGQPRSARLDWAKGLEVPVLGRPPAGALVTDGDGGRGARTIWRSGSRSGGPILYWVGCAGAFDERNRKVVRAMAVLLAQAGIDFAVLGTAETCTGDPARRAGNEYLYQMLAADNVAVLRAAHADHGVRTIVASCPHCFNTIRNEYPGFGLAGIEVIHHTELLDRLVADGRLVPDRHHAAVVAYHDACYLGRYNDVYEPGRRVVDAVPGQSVVEMDLHHRKGMCCGAGGARMWMEEREGQRINHRRAEQALATDATAIATACPFCLVMLRDGVTDLQREEVEVRDVAELLADATGAWEGPGVSRPS